MYKFLVSYFIASKGIQTGVGYSIFECNSEYLSLDQIELIREANRKEVKDKQGVDIAISIIAINRIAP